MQKKLGNVCITIGGQWGDEGKGKLIDYLSEFYDVVVRSGGGANAGHTLVVNGKKVVLHLMPSGILQGKQCIIGHGCVVDLLALIDEIHELDKVGVHSAGKILISDRAHIVFPFLKDLDAKFEEAKKSKQVGTTKRGIGPTYMFKASRKGLRVGDMVYDFEGFALQFRDLCALVHSSFGIEIDVEKELNVCRDVVDLIEGMVCDTTEYLIQAKKEGKKILLEGAQGALLDIDQGTYPYVTSSNTVSAGALTGSGINYKDVSSVIAITKAYTTRVGNGPFPTELPEDEAEVLRVKGGEYGATTGRPRRCGWLDLVLLKRVCENSGVTNINITKLDILSGISEIKVAVGYSVKGKSVNFIPMIQKDFENIEVEYKTLPGWKEDISKARNFDDLPKAAQSYIKFIEDSVGVPVSFIGVGADRNDFVIK